MKYLSSNDIKRFFLINAIKSFDVSESVFSEISLQKSMISNKT